ncbi:urease accessory protein UreF [Brevibacillus dissolubilis]|uniref:urease accessory protein UreF n=1 Tax=Brevibacillus dissolubilis TaxID=1844116 RepID=UPI00159B928E|nr:urease accessory UreF family protein [Brevibacillus dissolubilis]
MVTFLPLVQLIDSAFPTGSFSHSFGLETAMQEGRVRNAAQLTEWLRSYVTGSLSPMEGAAVLYAYQLAQRLIAEEPNSELTRENLKELDRKLTLSKLARESREGGMKIGRRYLYSVLELYPDSGLKEYESWVTQGECFGNSCIVHGWICAYLLQAPALTVVSHMYASVNSLVQNALRSMAIGQTDGQKVLQALIPIIEAEARKMVLTPVSEASLSCHNLMQEIEAMRHETLYSRLFMS